MDNFPNEVIFREGKEAVDDMTGAKYGRDYTALKEQWKNEPSELGECNADEEHDCSKYHDYSYAFENVHYSILIFQDN